MLPENALAQAVSTTDEIQKRIQDEMNTANELLQACVDRAITPEQFQTVVSSIVLGLKEDGLIQESEFVEMNTLVQSNTINCRTVQEHSNRIEEANAMFSKGMISADTLKSIHAASLSGLRDAGIINQDEYNNALAKLDVEIAQYQQKQAIDSASQPVAQPSQPVAQPSQPVAQPSQPVAQPSQPVAQPSQPVAQPSLPEAQPSQPVAQPSQPEAQPSQPEAQPSQLVAQPSQPEAQQPQQPSSETHTYQEYRDRIDENLVKYYKDEISLSRMTESYMDTIDAMKNDGVITQIQYEQLTEELDEYLKNGEVYHWFYDEMEKLNQRLRSGRMPMRRWKEGIDELIDVMENKGVMSHEVAEDYRKKTAKRAHDYFNAYYGSVTVTTIYHTSYGDWISKGDIDLTESMLHVRPSEFKIKIGLTGGANLDTFHAQTNGSNSDLRPDLFWDQRAEDEVLAYTALNLELSYTFRFANLQHLNMGLFVRTDFGCNFWTSDAKDHYDPQFMGTFVGGVRMEFYAWDSTLFIPIDIGVGFAYGTGDSRIFREDKGYKPAYFFDEELDNYINIAVLTGTAIDYFITDYVALGVGFYITLTSKDVWVREKVYDGGYLPTIRDANVKHQTVILQPDLHVIFAL